MMIYDDFRGFIDFVGDFTNKKCGFKGISQSKIQVICWEFLKFQNSPIPLGVASATS